MCFSLADVAHLWGLLVPGNDGCFRAVQAQWEVQAGSVWTEQAFLVVTNGKKRQYQKL